MNVLLPADWRRIDTAKSQCGDLRPMRAVRNFDGASGGRDCPGSKLVSDTPPFLTHLDNQNYGFRLSIAAVFNRHVGVIGRGLVHRQGVVVRGRLFRPRRI
jgi:hypothetical protein